MSKAFRPKEWVELRTYFEERHDKQLLLMETHESAGNYGMAYLALWSALESFAKRLGPIAQRQELKKNLADWLDYLNASGATIPSKIGAGKFEIPKIETVKIPPETLLQTLFPSQAGSSFYQAIDPVKKYRVRRNEIAHKGDAVSLKVYEDFKGVAVLALFEIEGWLAGGGV